jgi:uncharacterized protein
MSIFTGSKLRKKLYAYAFTHIDERYYVRELASLIGEDAGNLSRELRRLSEEGVFLVTQKGREKYYYINREYPLFNELKNIVFKTEGLEGSLRELVSGFAGIKTCFLYGSFASGKEKRDSDIDLAAVVCNGFDEKPFLKKLSALERKLGRDINYTLYEEADYRSKKGDEGGFLNKVLEGRIIVLKGDPWN